jgi:hypothetical protein
MVLTRGPSYRDIWHYKDYGAVMSPVASFYCVCNTESKVAQTLPGVMADFDIITAHCPNEQNCGASQVAELSVCLTARTFATAAVSGNWAQHWLYWVVSSPTSTAST